MPKICIVTPQIPDYYDEAVCASIEVTDWTEVDDATFRKLRSLSTFKNFSILEMPDQDAFIKKTVADYIKMAEDSARKEQEEQERREKKAQATALKRRAKTEQQERELLETLSVKYGKII